MSSEHVEDLLSAYLDSALTSEEHTFVAAHLQICASCNDVLADFRHFDALLAKQPRVTPSAVLRERIFTSPEYLELMRDTPKVFTDSSSLVDNVKNRQPVAQKRVRSDDTSRPRLVSIPGKLTPISPSSSNQETKARLRVPQRQGIQIQRFMQVMIAACLLLTVGVGSFIGWNLWQEQGKAVNDTHSITPPQDPRQGGPLPAGMHFVFLRNGSLWSGPEDGTTQAVRLTSTTVTVAPYWAVRPALSGHSAGDLLAYVDMKQGYIHLIRADGQSDVAIKQPLLKTAAAASWNTNSGSTILSSLSWSPDGSTLAFIAAPTGIAKLYTYSTNTGQTQAISLPGNGTVSHLVWSPNGVRIAFEFSRDAVTSILDYNIQTRGVLTVTSTVATSQYPNDRVLTLDWAPVNDAPAVTWSIGTQGHVHSIWLRHVGVSDSTGADGASPLMSGEYTQAVYSRSGESWLLSRTFTAHSDSLFVLALTAVSYKLADGNQIGTLQWTPDGKRIIYLDTFASGVRILHNIDVTTGINTLIASGVSNTPTPTWSLDGQHLLYSAGTRSFVVDAHNKKTQLPLQGSASTFTWSIASPHIAIVAIQDGAQGVYLVDTQHTTAKSISTKGTTGPIVWTQIL
ncbi:MAG: hypothetical protein NVS4B11_19260 [Ktedonobacteraceae bacterium]